MTVSYVRKAATASVYTFLKLLFRWRGSVWQLLHFELLVYLCLYNFITLLDNVFLAPNGYGKYFGVLVRYCQEIQPKLYVMLAVSMVFYVTQIYDRWWSVYTMMPWPDNLCFLLSTLIKERGPLYQKEDEDIRKRMCRYLCLSYVMVFRDISERIKARFPKLDHLEGSLITRREIEVLVGSPLLERVNWQPIEWIVVILKEMYRNGRINHIHYSVLITNLMNYRERLHNIMQYDTVNLPLIYTQVVFVVTYSYFLTVLFAIQRPAHNLFDMHWIYNLPIPILPVIEFLFLVGWFRSAEVMINPFGSDDDDFDLDLMIERNFYVSFNIVEWAIRRKPKKEDMAAPLEFPKRNFESMVEDVLRPHHALVGSAVPETEKSDGQLGQVPLIPDVENQAAKLLSVRRVSSQKSTAADNEREKEKKKTPAKSSVRAKLPTVRKARRKDKEQLSATVLLSKAGRLETPHASRAASSKSRNKSSEVAARSPESRRLAEPGNLREKLELLRKVERKRAQMEEEWTQWGDEESGEEQYNSQWGLKTPKASAAPSLRNPSLNVTQRSNLGSTQCSTHGSHRSTPSLALSATQSPATTNSRTSKIPKTSVQQLEDIVNSLKSPPSTKEKTENLEKKPQTPEQFPESAKCRHPF